MSKTRTAALLSALLLAALIAPPRAGSTLQRRALLSERPRHTNDMPSRRGKKISVRLVRRVFAVRAGSELYLLERTGWRDQALSAHRCRGHMGDQGLSRPGEQRH